MELEFFERVVAIDEQIFGPESTEVADDLEGLVEVLRQLGDNAAAGRLLDEGLAIATALGMKPVRRPERDVHERFQ